MLYGKIKGKFFQNYIIEAGRFQDENVYRLFHSTRKGLAL